MVELTLLTTILEDTPAVVSKAKDNVCVNIAMVRIITILRRRVS